MSKVVQIRTKGGAALKMGKVTHVRDISKCEAAQKKARVVLRMVKVLVVRINNIGQ